jgi:hypothetical protein
MVAGLLVYELVQTYIPIKQGSFLIEQDNQAFAMMKEYVTAIF